jgi:hypothetical protein
MKHIRNSAIYQAGKLIFIIYFGIILANYIIVLVTGRYTGNFIRASVKLSDIELFLNFLYTLSPIFVLYLIYKYYTQKSKKYKVSISIRALSVYLIIALPFSILVSLLYGVGRLGSGGEYLAPSWLRLIIIFINRLEPGFGVFLYSLLAPPKNKLKYFYLFLLIVLYLTRTSIAMVFTVFMVLILMHHKDRIFRSPKKLIPLLIIGIILLPPVVYNLYELRSKLRNDTYIKGLSITDIVFGRLMGRLSTYSSSALLLEGKDKFIPLVRENITFYEFPLAALPLPRPSGTFQYGHVLIGAPEKWFYSIGFSGVMTVGFYHSILTLFINIVTFFIIIYISFQLSSLFPYNKMKELFLLYLCLGATEGTSWAMFRDCVQSPVMYCLFFLIVNFLTKWNKSSGRYMNQGGRNI